MSCSGASSIRHKKSNSHSGGPNRHNIDFDGNCEMLKITCGDAKEELLGLLTDYSESLRVPAEGQPVLSLLLVDC